MNKLIVLVTMAGALLACGDSEEPSTTDAGGAQDQTACGDFEQLAEQLGCSTEIECAEVRPECEDEGRAWVACVRQDTTQCLCETDGDLNCEGSFKPNEGPARCIPQYTAFRDCDQS